MIDKAEPVWLDSSSVNQYAEARHRFNIGEFTGAAALQICSDTDYAVFLNGKFVGCGQYRTFPGISAYDEYDIEEFLLPGENTLQITAYYQGKSTQTYCKGAPMLVYAAVCGSVIVLSGSDTEMRICPYYENGRIEMVTKQLGFAYHYDASAPQTIWKSAKVQAIKHKYIKRPVKKLKHGRIVCGEICAQGFLRRDAEEGTPAELMQRDWLSARRFGEVFDADGVVRKSEGAYFVIDLGGETAGLFTMTLEATAGTVIDIGYGEQLDDLRVRTSVGGRNFACRYVCCDGEQSFTGYFRRFAGRYIALHITNMTGSVRFVQAGLIPTEYPIEKISKFICSDYLFNRLYEVSVKTLRLCMHEHYEDCPWREQALYTYDSMVQMLCGYYVFGEYEFAKASIKLHGYGQREDGLLELCAPCSVRRTIPSFSLSWVISLEKYVLYSGDVAFAADMLKTAERIMDAFDIKDNLVQLNNSDEYWNFYEWTEGMDNSESGGAYSCDAPSNMLYLLACASINRLYGWCGIDKAYATEAMRRAVISEFFDEESGLFRTNAGGMYHELTQALAVLCGAAEDERTVKKLAQRGNGLIKTTLSSSLYKYEALLSYSGEYAGCIADEIAQIWGDMLFSGADTLWETTLGARDFEYAGSRCHAWSAVPVYIFYKYYIGFEPLTPGFGEFKLSPKLPEKMNRICAELFTPSWKRMVEISADKCVYI